MGIVKVTLPLKKPDSALKIFKKIKSVLYFIEIRDIVFQSIYGVVSQSSDQLKEHVSSPSNLSPKYEQNRKHRIKSLKYISWRLAAARSMYSSSSLPVTTVPPSLGLGSNPPIRASEAMMEDCWRVKFSPSRSSSCICRIGISATISLTRDSFRQTYSLILEVHAGRLKKKKKRILIEIIDAAPIPLKNIRDKQKPEYKFTIENPVISGTSQEISLYCLFVPFPGKTLRPQEPSIDIRSFIVFAILML